MAKLQPTLLDGRNYDQLKTAVIASYESTKPELFEKLISKTTMSGRPSVYLQELSATASKIGVGQDIVRHKFIQASPSAITPVLAAQKSLTLDQLGSLADELMPYFNDRVMHVNKPREHQPDLSSSSTRQFNKESNYQNFNSAISKGIRPFSTNQRPKICRFHLYYAERANKCTQWCHWPNKNNCQIQPPSRPSSPAPSTASGN